FPAGNPVEDWVPVRRDGVESSVTAPAIPTLHGRVTLAQALPDLRQPISVRGFVVAVRVDGAVHLLACDAAGMKDVPVRWLEVESLYKVAVDRTVTATIRRTAEESNLGTARLDGERQSHLLGQLRRPRTSRQNDTLTMVPPVAGLGPDDPIAIE